MTMNDLMLIADLSFIRAYNTIRLDEAGGDQSSADGLVTFDHDGQEIYDPFVDESGRFAVEPLDYYGKEKMSQFTYRFYTTER